MCSEQPFLCVILSQIVSNYTPHPPYTDPSPHIEMFLLGIVKGGGGKFLSPA